MKKVNIYRKEYMKKMSIYRKEYMTYTEKNI